MSTDYIVEDHTIRHMRERLSDGSIAHNVYLGNRMFPARTETDALCLAYKLADAINEHTNELARVMS